VGSRKRLNYIDGLAKETHATPSCEWVIKWAELFSSELRIKGAWFFQYKFDDTGQPVLLEIGLRIAGASGLARLKGVNLSLLNLYLFTDPNTSLAIYGQENQARISGNGIFNLGFEFNAIYVDLDDTLLVRDSLNIPLLHYLRNSSKKGVSLRILTRNADALRVVSHISNQVPIENIHIVPNSDRKSDYVDTNDKFLFIDDSHRERMDIKQTFKDQALVLDPSFCWQHNFI
jgi:hypothetical protein